MLPPSPFRTRSIFLSRSLTVSRLSYTAAAAAAAGLIVLMAQMGSFVPAEMAVVPVRDSLLSRIGTGDDMENNASTFLMEMREVAQVGVACSIDVLQSNVFVN